MQPFRIFYNLRGVLFHWTFWIGESYGSGFKRNKTVPALGCRTVNYDGSGLTRRYWEGLLKAVI